MPYLFHVRSLDFSVIDICVSELEFSVKKGCWVGYLIKGEVDSIGLQKKGLRC